MLQRIRTLAVQAANGTNTEKDRQALQEEVKSLSHEISRIAHKTTFAGANVLLSQGAANGLKDDAGNYFFQVGANANDTINLLMVHGFHMQGIMSAAEEATGTNYEFQDGDPKTNLIKAGEADKFGLFCSDIDQKSLAYWVVAYPSCAQKTLEHIDNFIQAVDSSRAALGAIQNRMESTIRNQSSIAENESDARSRIRDTDFASETAALTQNQIIQQASQTILSQANQRPTVALNLLGG